MTLIELLEDWLRDIVVAPFVPLARHWSRVGTWLTMLTVAVFDVAVMIALLAR
jgi:hypothetical protein